MKYITRKKIKLISIVFNSSNSITIPYSLFPIPYSLFPIPYSLFPIPYSLFPIPYSPE
ncbi:MAG: hypothetical protein F6K50_01030 [Moorea sp. SIO3I7]|nr:hypothetical protein [Moorena sp. SIO3I7]